MREICFDTETTGLEVGQGDRIIEIYAVAMPLAKDGEDEYFHKIINPQRPIPDEARFVHGISNEDVADAPTFADIADSFIEFIKDARLIAHNAPFDVGFIDMELKRAGKGSLQDYCAEVVDTLELARVKFPQQRNSLDHLCQRCGIPNLRPPKYIDPKHKNHGAIRDARMLALLYPALKQSQGRLEVKIDPSELAGRISLKNAKVIKADKEELKQHEEFLDMLAQKSKREPNYRMPEDEFNELRKQEKEKIDEERIELDEFLQSL